MIKRIRGKYMVVSETTGRSFGAYDTRAGAQKRLRQVEYFKHLNSSIGSKVPRKRARSR